MANRPEGPLEQLLTAARAAPPRAAATAVIAIDGRSGAGKSTLGQLLARELDAPLVALEDLYGGWDGLEAGVSLLRSAVLRRLLAAGVAARVPRYDWHAAAWAQPWLLAPPERLIVEGVGAGARSVAPYTSLLIWLEQRSPLRRERALLRDGELYAPHWQRWALQEEAFVARERPLERADFVLDAEQLGLQPA